eukprot:m.723 g.723  ORF g.723 m.723 type:complete len:62 (-) comp641_c0_seq1:71-256(-)
MCCCVAWCIVLSVSNVNVAFADPISVVFYFLNRILDEKDGSVSISSSYAMFYGFVFICNLF